VSNGWHAWINLRARKKMRRGSGFLPFSFILTHRSRIGCSMTEADVPDF
jgi:hypothetical protein